MGKGQTRERGRCETIYDPVLIALARDTIHASRNARAPYYKSFALACRMDAGNLYRMIPPDPTMAPSLPLNEPVLKTLCAWDETGELRERLKRTWRLDGKARE